MPTDIQSAAQARAAAGTKAPHRPAQRRMPDVPTSSPSRGAAPATVQARAASEQGSTRGVFGVASVVEHGYEMYDMFGPYTEVVDRAAFDNTLAASPLVEFTLNHNRGGGLPMAHTRNGTLTLSMGEPGLEYDATVDPTRSDVSDMLKALERGDLAEASFKFTITRGQWSPDYSEFRILEVNLDRGDVSAVNFGANPAATSQARAANDASDGNVIAQALGWISAIDSIVDEAQESLSAYLGVPNPDMDDAQENDAQAPMKVRSSVTDDDTRPRTIRGL